MEGSDNRQNHGSLVITDRMFYWRYIHKTIVQSIGELLDAHTHTHNIV